MIHNQNHSIRNVFFFFRNFNFNLDLFLFVHSFLWSLSKQWQFISETHENVFSGSAQDTIWFFCFFLWPFHRRINCFRCQNYNPSDEMQQATTRDFRLRRIEAQLVLWFIFSLRVSLNTNFKCILAKIIAFDFIAKNIKEEPKCRFTFSSVFFLFVQLCFWTHRIQRKIAFVARHFRQQKRKRFEPNLRFAFS